MTRAIDPYPGLPSILQVFPLGWGVPKAEWLFGVVKSDYYKLLPLCLFRGIRTLYLRVWGLIHSSLGAGGIFSEGKRS